MEAQTLPSNGHVKSHGTLRRELESSNDYETHNIGAVGGVQELDELKMQLSSSSSDIKVSKPNSPLQGFIGLKEIKRDILCYLDKSLGAKCFYERDNFEDNDRILIFGETGTGKAHLIRAIATELNANLIEFANSTILSQWASSMELYTEAIHKMCQEKGPMTILFINHLDVFCIREEEKRALVRFIRTIQTQWEVNDNDNMQPSSRLVIIASTNRPNLLDEKVTLGFDRRIYIPTLNFIERRQLFQRMIQKQWKWGHVLAPRDMEWLARKTYRILTSEIEKLVDRAVAIQYPKHGLNGTFDDTTWRSLEKGDFEQVVKGYLVLDSKSFFEFETFQRNFGNGPFMRIYEREDYDEDAPSKSGKKKRGWVWTAFSWL